MPQILDVVALSPTQAGMTAISRADLTYDPYLVTISLDLVGVTPHLISRLRPALAALCRRHPHLLGRVRSEGLPHPVLLVLDSGCPIWQVYDFRTEPDPMAAAQRFRATEGNRPLSISDGPLIRATLLHVGGEDSSGHCILLLTMHHLVIDGWCMPLLIEELVALIRGDEALLGPPTPLRNHAAWLAAQEPTVAQQAWREELEDLEEMPRLGRRISVLAPVVGEQRIGAADSTAILTHARQQGLTLATLAQLAWARILSSAAGRDDVVFGNTSSGRHPEIPGGDRIIGGLVTTTPVRVRVDDRPPNEAGAELQARLAQLRRHDWLGSSGVSQALGVGGRELFDSLLVVENTPAGDVHRNISLGDGATSRLLRIDSPSHYPVTVVVLVDGEEIVVRVESHDTRIPDSWAFADPTRTARRIAVALEDLVTAPSLAGINILLPEEVDHLAGSPGREDLPESIDEMLQEVATRAPRAQALVDVFGELDLQGFQSGVDSLARTLRQAGLRSGEPVAVALPRDRRAVIAPFAIAAAGGVTVHLDPIQPVARMSQIIADAGSTLVLTEPSTAEALTQMGRDVRCGVVDPSRLGQVSWRVQGAPAPGELPISPERRLAYVVFTSGSSGRAKGVAVSHEALLSYWSHHDRHILGPAQRRLGRPIRVAHAWSTGFDAAWQPQVALLSGHSVHVVDEETRNDPGMLVRALRDHQIDMIDTTPSMVLRLLDAGFAEAESRPSILALGGEAIAQDLWDRLRSLGGTVWNCYGPTEATVECFMACVEEHVRPTIGVPLDGMSAAVLDHRLRPLPAGMSGQLVVWGAQLAEGYVGLDKETAAAFPNGLNGRRLYLTGDRARRTVEDTVVFEGRCDEQLKINGYRVEPDEVATVLRSLPGVLDACVVTEEEQGRPWLGALVVTEHSVAAVRRLAAMRLPTYLLPRVVAVVQRLPVTHNGKLDRAAASRYLKQTSLQESGQGGHQMTPQLEDLLTAVSRMTGSAPSPSSRLDDLGLDSIAVMDLATSLRHPVPGGRIWQVSVRDLVESPSIADAALRMRQSVDQYPGDSRGDSPTFVLARLARAHVANSGEALASMTQSQLVTLPEEGMPQLQHMTESLLAALVAAHPSLTARLDDNGSELVAGGLPPVVDILPAGHSLAEARAAGVRCLDPWRGPLCAASVRLGAPGRPPVLLLTVHHLAVDVVSWHILAEDIQRFGSGLEIVPESLVPADSSAMLNRDLPDRRPLGPTLASRHCDPRLDVGIEPVVCRRVASATTSAVLGMAKDGLGVDDILGVVTAWTDREFAATRRDPAGEELWFTIEVHGREGLEESRAVGWFTAELTRRAPVPQTLDAGWIARTVAASSEDEEALAASCLNYLGRMDLLSAWVDTPWQILDPGEALAELGAPELDGMPARFSMTVTAHVEATAEGPVLVASFAGARGLLGEAQIEEYATRWLRNVALSVNDMEEKDR
ncbi:AMP-binding protein [Arachnia propionica]|uniref:Peptide synthetase n=1 Tax=Arachnia propionica TaxID=1750 RepID=A0A3P1WV19_9ACTN|nr:AMP-binding protein [Arachnia propionica]RRD49748.1 peptide synthetase [Arachnia propionica]